MSDTFCALPFQHLAFGGGGRAQMCCMANGLIIEHGAPMSLSTHSLEEIWNSAYMRDIRRRMLKGERLSACQACYESEAVSGHSYRTLTGLGATKAEVRKDLKPDFRVNTHPSFLKLELGNLCNIKCRMCFGVNSSEIERDPVHNRWTQGTGGIDPLNAVWRGGSARIGPEPRIGVRTSGVFPQEEVNGSLRCWTDGHAIFHVPMRPGTQITDLELTFHPVGARDQHFQIIINGRPVMKGVLCEANTQAKVDVRGFRDDGEMTLEILSNKIVETAGEPERGLPLGSLILNRELADSNAPARPQRLASRMEADGPWYMDDHKLFHEVLNPALRRLNVTGGETLINERFVEILDFLVSAGLTHIALELPTNCTHIDDSMIERLKSFQRVKMILSLDGVGATYEYIRYPARWSVVEANVRKLVQSGLPCVAAPVVQVYNVMRLPELYRYCDAMGLQVVENILFEPNRLAIGILPPRIRKKAAANIFRYCETECQISDKTSRLALAEHLNNLTSPVDPEKLSEFMLFTNDLDATRRQSFRQTHPELVELLAQDGFEWTDATVFAKGENRKTPARERDYAWL